MILVLNCYDSFVYNLCDIVESLGHEFTCQFYDKISAKEIEALRPKAIILSPGPNHPKDYPSIVKLLDDYKGKIPILGVCLGHQIIGYGFGAKIIQTYPAHGKSDFLTHNQDEFFKNIPTDFTVARYHSLCVSDEDFPDELEIIAKNQSGLVMALKHKSHKIYGVQFHPESILSEQGKIMIENFLSFAKN